jgi:GDP-4-dehydro-6-deoxy-D-mannose reductase
MITGISGFAGLHLAEHLLGCGDAVLGCSPEGGWLDAPPCFAERVEMAGWDIGQEGPPAAVRRMVERFAPDAIYHLAALSVPVDCGQCEPSPAAVAVNVGGTRRVLELAASLGSHPRVMLVSTSHVYSAATPGWPRVDENSSLDPRTGYARSKFLAEEETRRAVSELGCDAVIVRAFNHTGPGQTPRLMLPQWARQLVAGGSQPIEVYTRDAYLDMTDVRDVVRAYRLVIEHGQRGETYNVGSGINRRSGDILDLLCALAGQAHRPTVELRPGLIQGPIADISRVAAVTGWRPEIPLEKTVMDTLEWWQGRK